MNSNQTWTIKKIYRHIKSHDEKITRVKIERIEGGSIMVSFWHEFTSHWFGKHFTLYVIGSRGGIRKVNELY
jgi:hemerythrin